MKSGFLVAFLTLFVTAQCGGYYTASIPVPRDCDEHDCSLPADPGPCEGLFPSWFFNSKTDQCEEFNYGGCQGNSNRFETIKDCQAACGTTTDRCSLPADPGPCEAAIPSWFYNSKTEQCEEFIYGGCKGNENRFDTLEDCEASCVSPPVDVAPGPCEALNPSWFFNSKTGQCEEFNYGGCQGNGNRFPTEAECEAACEHEIDICTLPPDSGPCEALGYRWFYNPRSGECEQFTYGGCQGNANNFGSRLECQKACRDDCDFVLCDADPCDGAVCNAFPDAKCVSNTCNGCSTDFLGELGELLKYKCHELNPYEPSL